MKKHNNNKGNETNIEEIPYKPIPEITAPGVVTDPDSSIQSANEDFGTNDVDTEDLERMRGWSEQNKL